MYPATLINRRRRPRRTLDHLFGDDENLVVPEEIPVTRPRTIPVRADEFAPYEGTRPAGSFAGDAPAPVVRALPPVVRPAYPTDPNIVDVESLGEPPLRGDPNAPFGSSGEPFGSARPRRRTQPRDYVADAAQYMRDVESEPVERNRLKSAGAGFQRGGVIGALIGAVRPEMYGEFKRERKLTRARERLGEEIDLQKTERARRLEPLQERLLESQVLENEAQAAARMRPPRPILGKRFIDETTAVQTRLNPETGRWEDEVDVEGNPIIVGRKKDEQMVAVTLSDGTRGMVSFDKALTADVQREIRDERRDTRQEERDEKFQGNLTKREAKLREAADLTSNAEIYDNNAIEVERQLVNASKEDAPGLLAQINGLKQEAQMLRRQAVTARSEAAAIPQSRPDRPSRASEDPNVRRYANEFFRGDYNAADAAIKRQRGGQ